MKIVKEDVQLAAHVIRGLSMDGVEAAKSGHPGMPMGMADVAAVLWMRYMNYSPGEPSWPNRDRFVLSAGHGSMLLYSLLHLAGYDLPLEELMKFRQLGSLTPGHPEYGETVGVETTTGPLSQGCGNAVGMAIAERMLAERFNRPDFEAVDHYTYVIASDGDFMEGLSHEAFALAGHLGLHKLVVFYDDNNITIEGATSLAYSDDVRKRFQGYHWNVLEVDAHDIDQVDKAIRKVRREKERPTLIICRSHIAQGAPNARDTAEAHGAPLGAEEIAAAKRNLGLPPDASFHVPDTVRAAWEKRRKQLERKRRAWQRQFKACAKADPEWAARWKTFMDNTLPEDLESVLPAFDPQKPVATRSASGKVMQKLAEAVPQLVGGSADLAPSTKTLLDASTSIARGAFAGRNFHFGVREHGMCAILNGMALHGGFRTFGSTFFVFADYCRPSIRLAAIMRLPVVYVFTHDSIYVGEDGPTHEPVEQLPSLRCMPGITIIRPADATETAAAWVAALRNTSGPTALLLSRQNIPIIDRGRYPASANLARGAYTLWQSAPGRPDIVLIASGSEVDLAMRSAQELAADDGVVRVVSMPSWELFEAQPAAYRNDVLPPSCRVRVAIEAASPMGWEKYVGDRGAVVGVHRFGASAPYKQLGETLGFTTENVVATVRRLRNS